jgi:hypothetical protein
MLDFGLEISLFDRGMCLLVDVMGEAKGALEYSI